MGWGGDLYQQCKMGNLGVWPAKVPQSMVAGGHLAYVLLQESV